jgi:fucose 4-O-acetylase-like acetyltransferase
MTKRIEYIDALRGFTMILVVAVHIYSLCFMQGNVEEYDLSYNNFFGLFRMPLFFFISGFVFYKSNRLWNLASLNKFFKDKIRVQLFSTSIFFLLFCFLFQRNIQNSLIDSQKAGYWFTLVLFIYFSFYISIDKFICWIGKVMPFNNFTIITTLLIGILLCFSINNGLLLNILPPHATSLLSVSKWQYFLHFSFGCAAHKYYSYFIKWQEYKFIKDGILLLFTLVAICIFYQNNNGDIIMSNTILKLCTSLLGIVIVMFLFKENESYLQNSTRLGKTLQYIGKRTLDIYFLHYFFLPYNLSKIGIWLRTHPNPLLEFFASTVLASIVIICCLIVSRVIHSGSILTFLLLGGKRK